MEAHVVYTFGGPGSAAAPPAGAALPGPRVISERTVAVYSGTPPTGNSMSAPVTMPSGVPMTAAMPALATPAAVLSPNGAMSYGQPSVGAAYASTAVACALPGTLGAIQPVGSMWAPPAPPRSLAAGIPDPTAVETQKSAYSKSLDDQLRHGEEMLKLQQKQQTDYIFQAAEAQKKQMLCQIAQNAKQQEIQLSQQYAEKQMKLQKEYQHQKLLLEKQANDLHIKYQRTKVQQEMITQQYEMQKAHQEDHMRMASQHPSAWPSGFGTKAVNKSDSMSNALFNMIDSNKDGVITKKELEQAMHKAAAG